MERRRPVAANQVPTSRPASASAARLSASDARPAASAIGCADARMAPVLAEVLAGFGDLHLRGRAAARRDDGVRLLGSDRGHRDVHRRCDDARHLPGLRRHRHARDDRPLVQTGAPTTGAAVPVTRIAPG